MQINIDNKKLNYIREGSDSCQKIVLVHGWGGSINSLKSVHDYLKIGLNSYILDLPGFGDSSKPDENWGVDEYSEFLYRSLSTLGVKKCNYFGHSFGGALGINIAAKYPEFIENLILCAPSFKRPLGKEFLPLTQMQKSFSLIRMLYYKVFHPESDVSKRPELENNFRKIITQDLSHLLPKITQRTLVIWGDQDRQTPVAHALVLKENLKNCELRIISDAGHNLPIKKPLEVSALVKTFIGIQ